MSVCVLIRTWHPSVSVDLTSKDIDVPQLLLAARWVVLDHHSSGGERGQAENPQGDGMADDVLTNTSVRAVATGAWGTEEEDDDAENHSEQS